MMHSFFRKKFGDYKLLTLFSLILCVQGFDDYALHFVDLDFVIAGFPSSGTCSLVHYLKSHPHIYLTPALEDNLFWRANYSVSTYRSWRRGYPFRGDRVVRIGSSVDDLKSPDGRSLLTNGFGERFIGETISESDSSADGDSESTFLNSAGASDDSISQDAVSSKNLEAKPSTGTSSADAPVSTRQRNEESIAVAAHRLRIQENLGISAEPIKLLGLKDPLLIFSPEALQMMGRRLALQSFTTKILYLIRDPMEMIISWLQSGASFRTPWDENLHYGIGFYVEHLNIARAMVERGVGSSEIDVKPQFLYVPSHQLDVNTVDTMNKVFQFLGASTSSEGGDDHSKSEPASKNLLSFKDRLHVGRYKPGATQAPQFFFPGELDFCVLDTAPFLAAAYEGQRQLLENMIDNEGQRQLLENMIENESGTHRFSKPYFDNSPNGDIPKQCRGPRWVLAKRNPKSSIAVRKKSVPFEGSNKPHNRRLYYHRHRTKIQKYRLVWPTTRLLHACTLARHAGKPELLDISEAECEAGLPFNYEAVRKGKPNVCTAVSEIKPFFNQDLAGVQKCKLRAESGESSGDNLSLSPEDLCKLCCIELSPRCSGSSLGPGSNSNMGGSQTGSTSGVKKLPNCCINKLSAYIGPVGYFVTQEICGQAMGCQGRNFDTPENKFS